MAAAQQALKPSWVSLKFSPDHLSASMEYSQAATKFRAAGLLAEAVDAWVRTGEMKEKLNDVFGAGRAYESAGTLCDGSGPGGPQAAAGHWSKAATCFRLCGKAEIAAKLILKLAEQREKQGDIAGAKAAYDEAIDVFQTDEKDYNLGDVYKQYIGFLVRCSQLEDALRVIDAHVELLLKQAQPTFAYKELLSKMVLCLDAQDTVRAEQALSPTCDVPGWYTSRECQVGSELVSAFQANDAAELERVLKEQVFTFLQVEIARLAKKLRLPSFAAPVVARPGDVRQAAAPSTVDDIASSLL